MEGCIDLNKLQEFIGIVNSKIGEGYAYGGQNDDPLTKDVLAKLVKKFGRNHYYFSNYSAERWLGKEYYDCSGLIVYTLRKMKLITNTMDYSAQNIYTKLCTAITADQLRTGDLCFNKTTSGIIHVGIYMGNNRVTHARSTFYGVVNTLLFTSFNTFGRLEFFANNYPEVKVTLEKSIKKVVTASAVFEQPYELSESISKLAVGDLVNVEGITDNSWYLISINGKKGYVPLAMLRNYDELVFALEFLSKKTGISKEYWYKQANSVKWLDVCFIAIAKSFGAIL